MARVEINLLPRELRRKRRSISFDKNLTIIAAFAGLLVVLFVGINVFQGIKLKALNAKIAEAQRKADELRKNIELVDALTELKGKVLQRMSAIEALDRNRTVWVRVLEDLNRRVPDYLWLSLLREEESQNQKTPDPGTETTGSFNQIQSPVTKRVTIEGYSYSLNSLASFLIQLMGSKYFKNMELQFVKRAKLDPICEADKEDKTFSFQLVGDLYYLPDFESPDADTAVHELALTNERKDDETNLAVGRE
ncbi:MAG: PilN domain-containing protein [candidate division Zixibacteria bacterium]|nr:PilN domain-containing protein [candidate division Zixibacteria bacterium]